MILFMIGLSADDTIAAVDLSIYDKVRDFGCGNSDKSVLTESHASADEEMSFSKSLKHSLISSVLLFQGR